MASVEDALAATLRKLREENGLSQKQVADVLGVKQPYVARWEKSKTEGGATPSPTTLNNVSVLYKTTPAAMITAATDSVPPPDDIVKRARQLEQEINRRKK